LVDALFSADERQAAAALALALSPRRRRSATASSTFPDPEGPVTAVTGPNSSSWS
jgi:hypothetical protein